MSRSFSLKPSAVVCGLVVSLSLSAYAQKPKVVVVPFAAGDGASETATSKFTSLFVDELKTRGDVLELVTPPTTKAAPPVAAPSAPTGSASKGPNPEAVAALEAGRKAFEDLRFEDAVAGLRKGIDGLLADPATADIEAVTDAYVKLAAASFRMGEEKDAKAALLDLARIGGPEYQMPPGFPPVFQREFEKAKKRLEKAPKGSLSIEGPPGATAYVDGRDLGMVPVLEENVSGGPHYVKVEGGRSERFGQVVQVTGGVVKVKASFGGAGERQVVTAKAGVADPAISATIDNDTQNRLLAYVKAAGADYAFVGYVYKTSDSQLTAGTALFNPKKTAFTTLTPVAFDTDVLTANTEAYKLADDLTKKLTAFGAVASLPINLAVKPAKAGTSSGTVVARNDRPNNEDLEGSGPKSTGKKVVLIPKDPQPEKTEVKVDPEVIKPVEGKPAEASGGVPAWVWVVTGVAVAAGAGVGGYFGITALTKPVTGTVTATW